MQEDIVTWLEGTVTSFRRLKGITGVRSICRSKELDPDFDLAEDGRQLMARTMFCGYVVVNLIVKSLACKSSHLEKHVKPSTNNHETTNTCESGHPRWHTSRLDVELSLKIEPPSSKKTDPNSVTPEKIVDIR